MDNKQFPEQEEPGFIPEQNPELPAEEVSVPPDAVDHEMLSHPPVGEEITPDEHAMAWHGMTHPSEPEPPFDLSILDDPELDEPAAPAPTAEIRPEDISSEPSPTISVEKLFRDQEFHEAFGDGEEFDKAFEEPAPEEPPAPAMELPVRKGRPKKKKGEGLFGIPNILVTCVWLAITLVIGVTLGRMLWVCAADVLAFGREDKVVTVTVYQSDTIEDITEKLHNAGLIQYPGLFKIYASLAVDEGEIQPGIWDLNTRYDYHALVNMMSASSSREVIEITIPEGYTCSQIFALLEEKKVCTARDLADWAANGELNDYWFLEGIQRGEENCLEGFLFPDTYEFYKNDSARNALQRMLNNFEIRFSEEMQVQITALNDHLASLMKSNGRDEAYIAEHMFGIREVVIVASLIEKETANTEESPMIASVIYNRLFNWGSTPAYLNIDASIIYAQGGDTSSIDTSLDSPYNTYTNTGLTPGPIANPGLASLKAALSPAASNYYFYVLNPSTGSHQFSSTLEEHESWRSKFAVAAASAMEEE